MKQRSNHVDPRPTRPLRTSNVLHSIVIPVLNEESALPHLLKRLQELLSHLAPLELEIIFVDDGSTDRSFELLSQAHTEDPRIRVLRFSRNFGHQVAITAGMEWADGQTVTVIDADLQDPPELIAEMIAQWKSGYDVVYAIRKKREGETWAKKLTAAAFYKLLTRMTRVKIPENAGDFRLMDKQVVEAFLRMPEKHRFVRGMIAWLGFKCTSVEFVRQERVAGETHYPFFKMLRFAIDGITSFSHLPLQFAIHFGFLCSGSAILLGLWALISYFVMNNTITGWTSLTMIVLFLGGGQFLILGLLGEYLGRTYEESKRRPLYVLMDQVGFNSELPQSNTVRPKESTPASV